MKRQLSNGGEQKHIATALAMFEIKLFEQNGWKIIDHGLKITAEKQ